MKCSTRGDTVIFLSGGKSGDAILFCVYPHTSKFQDLGDFRKRLNIWYLAFCASGSYNGSWWIFTPFPDLPVVNKPQPLRLAARALWDNSHMMQILLRWRASLRSSVIRFTFGSQGVSFSSSSSFLVSCPSKGFQITCISTWNNYNRMLLIIKIPIKIQSII